MLEVCFREIDSPCILFILNRRDANYTKQLPLMQVAKKSRPPQPLGRFCHSEYDNARYVLQYKTESLLRPRLFKAFSIASFDVVEFATAFELLTVDCNHQVVRYSWYEKPQRSPENLVHTLWRRPRDTLPNSVKLTVILPLDLNSIILGFCEYRRFLPRQENSWQIQLTDIFASRHSSSYAMRKSLVVTVQRALTWHWMARSSVYIWLQMKEQMSSILSVEEMMVQSPFGPQSKPSCAQYTYISNYTLLQIKTMCTMDHFRHSPSPDGSISKNQGSAITGCYSLCIRRRNYCSRRARRISIVGMQTSIVQWVELTIFLAYMSFLVRHSLCNEFS